MDSKAAPPPKSPLKQGMMQITSGGIAGFIEICIMHPLDIAKTRLQMQVTGSGAVSAGQPGNVYYNGVFDCFAKMYKQEGVLSFWKGILPPILVETPKTAVRFFTFEQSKKLFLFGESKPTPLTFSLAGFTAGTLEAFLINPFEVVKVTMQANKSKAKEAPGTWQVAKEIIEKDGFGLRGINKGLGATVGRHNVWCLIYFGFYHSVKDVVPQYQDPTKEFLRKFTIGFFSGTIASCVNIPFDVAKSRIQGPQPVPGQVKYSSTFPSIALVAREEGIGALYKGLVPKVMRLGPGGAIMLLIFEYVYKFLDS